LKVALDTSVLVAALVRAHQHHERAQWWFGQPASRIQRTAAWHAYAETWSTLTSLPLEPSIPGETARASIGSLRERLRWITSGAAVYQAAVDRCAQLGLHSGAVYDALHLVTAEKEEMDLFLTFNVRDFERLAADRSPRIAAPPDPPGLP